MPLEDLIRAGALAQAIQQLERRHTREEVIDYIQRRYRNEPRTAVNYLVGRAEQARRAGEQLHQQGGDRVVPVNMIPIATGAPFREGIRHERFTYRVSVTFPHDPEENIGTTVFVSSPRNLTLNELSNEVLKIVRRRIAQAVRNVYYPEVSEDEDIEVDVVSIERRS